MFGKEQFTRVALVKRMRPGVSFKTSGLAFLNTASGKRWGEACRGKGDNANMKVAQNMTAYKPQEIRDNTVIKSIRK